jgi:pimeloyl-ACP methyl ester carboxylesterase
MSEARGRAHVILIHGTFARGADWIQEDAPLRHYLRGALGDAAASTAIEAFNWSGRNSFKARTDAALKLQALIARIVAADPGARVYLVGHSHGGNIALQAAADPETGRSIDGIVCLATPVMHSTLVAASPDDSGRAIRLWTMIAALVPVGLIADRVALDAAAEWTQVRPAWLVGIVSVAILLVSALARLVVLRLRRHGRIESFNLRAAVRLNALLRPPRLDHARIVFVRHAGDEATLTANFLGLLGYLSDWASSILEQRYRRLDTMLGSQIGKRLAIAFVVASIALVGFFQLIHAPEIRGIVFGVLLMALAVPPLVSLVLRLTRAFGTLRTLFFGVAVVPIGSFIRIGVETTPPGLWTVVMLPEPREAAPDDVATAAVPIVDAHCRVYRQPEFLAFVSDWIATRVRAAREA